MNKLLFFSTNQNKIKEIKKLFYNRKIKILTLNNFKNISEPKESGKIFAENAKIKSNFGFQNLHLPCFADDSGICISALNNKPGVKSKRFLENFKNNHEAFNFIIKKTKDLNNTNAYFKTSICITLNQGQYIIFEGIIHGNIAEAPKGLNGFGYDPIFIPSGYKKTFGEMNNKEKNLISHRGIAINKLKDFLTN